MFMVQSVMVLTIFLTPLVRFGAGEAEVFPVVKSIVFFLRLDRFQGLGCREHVLKTGATVKTGVRLVLYHPRFAFRIPTPRQRFSSIVQHALCLPQFFRRGNRFVY